MAWKKEMRFIKGMSASLFSSSKTTLVWLPSLHVKSWAFLSKSSSPRCKRTWESMIWLLWMLEKEASLQRCTFLLGFYNFLFLLSLRSWERTRNSINEHLLQNNNNFLALLAIITIFRLEDLIIMQINFSFFFDQGERLF